MPRLALRRISSWTAVNLSGVAPLEIILGIVAVLGACFAVYVALLTDLLLSSGDAGDHQSPQLIAQLVVAFAGLIPAGGFARSLYRADDNAGVWLVAGIVAYLAWGILNDAAVHGVNHLKVF